MDSASGNLKSARNNEFQAVMPVRGKILNCQKSTLEKISKNAEIMTMIDAFGLKRDPRTLKLTYDKDDLRYGKIIIAADGDADGSHIPAAMAPKVSRIKSFFSVVWMNWSPDAITPVRVAISSAFAQAESFSPSS